MPFAHPKSGILLLLVCLIAVHSRGNCAPVCLVYPDISDPYSRVFSAIEAGIIQGLDPVYNLQIYTIRNGTHASELNRWLSSNCSVTVITLGSLAYKQLRRTQWNRKRVIGALYIRPKHGTPPGVSLYIDPSTLTRSIGQLFPHIEKIYVAGGATYQRSIEQANETVPFRPKIDFTVVPDHDREEKTRFYWNTLRNMNPDVDVLMLDHRIHPDLLYHLVEKAWQRRCILVSPTLSHLERGVAAVIYPNNREMGRQIASIAESQLHNKSNFTFTQMLKAVSVGINRKIFEHLHIKPPKSKQIHN